MKRRSTCTEKLKSFRLFIQMNLHYNAVVQWWNPSFLGADEGVGFAMSFFAPMSCTNTPYLIKYEKHVHCEDAAAFMNIQKVVTGMFGDDQNSSASRESNPDFLLTEPGSSTPLPHRRCLIEHPHIRTLWDAALYQLTSSIPAT